MEDYADFKSAFNEKYSPLSRKILRLLSEDSRMPVTAIAKQVGVSRRTAKERIGRIEKELGVRYTLELNEEVLRIPNPHMVVVRFREEPDYDEIAKVLSRSYIPQLAVRANGEREIYIYANSVSHSEYTRWDKTTQSDLSKYKVLWESSEVAHKQLGFFPLRNEIIDRLEIAGKYKSMLKLLNSNSRISFQQMSKAMGMHFNTVAYNFGKLLKLGYIKKFTLVCRPPKEVSLVAIFGKYALAENFESDASKIRRVFRSDEELTAFARYPVIAQLIGTYDFFDVGVFDNMETGKKKFVSVYKEMLKRHLARIYHRELADVILGDMPIRSVDDNKEYNVLKWTTEEKTGKA